MADNASAKAGLATRPLVIGVGTKFRGDDEAGLVAVDTCRNIIGDREIDFSSHSDDPARLMDEWKDRQCVVIVDAVRTGSAPGTLHRFAVNTGGLTPRSRTSSHGDALADAIELSRVLGTLPEKLVILGIEAGDTGLGNEISAECWTALPALIESVKEELRCMSLP